MKPIGPQHGIEAARIRWKALDPGKAWPDKLADTLLELVAGHNELAGDAQQPAPAPTVRLAPRTYNLGTNDSDPRFCISAPGVTQVGPNRFRDEGGYEYDSNGLNSGGNWRDRTRMVPGLKPANEMDGRGACDPYGPFPPWPAESYLP